MLQIDRQTFIKHYLLTFSIATFAIPLLGGLLEIFLGVYSLEEIIQTVFHYTIFYIAAVYILGIYLTRHYLYTYTDIIETAFHENDYPRARKFIKKISYLILLNLLFILVYTQGGPATVNYYLLHDGARSIGPDEITRSYIATLPTVLMILFPVYFYLHDQLGKYVAPRLVINLLPIGVKVLALGLVVPLLIDIMLLLFFYDRTGFFSSETLGLWFAMLTIAAAGSWLTYRSFHISLRPLQNLLLDSTDSSSLNLVTTPNSLDEIGLLVQGWQKLVTKLDESNVALVDERNFSSTIINNANALVVVLDNTGNIVEFNKGCEKATGYAAGEVLGKKVWDYFILPEQIDNVRQVFDNLTNQPINNSYQNYWRTKSEGRRLIDWSNSSVLGQNDQVQYIVSIGVDITDRNIIEEELRRSKDTLDRAQAIAHIGHWDWDIVTNDLSWSDEIYRIFGLQPQEFGATYPAFLQYILAEDVDKVTTAVNVSVANADIPYNVEHRIIRPDGEIRFVHEQGEIYRDEKGTPLRMVGTVHDITERVKAEEDIRKLNTELEQRVIERTRELEKSLSDLKQTQQHLIQSEKMAALGGLVAGVAHEINTPIGIGVTAISHLQMKLDQYNDAYKSGELTKENFENLIKAANETSAILHKNLKRAATLISSFKQVAVDQSSEKPRLINLHDYTDEVIHSLQPKLRSGNYSIHNDTDYSLEIYSLPGAISQILTNFIINSIVHGFSNTNHGDIHIRFYKEQEQIHLQYRDNGRGIDKQHLEKIFDPFFTTRREHGSSGLGMNIVYNIVTQSLGGTINVESEAGHGVLFNVTIMPLGENHVES